MLGVTFDKNDYVSGINNSRVNLFSSEINGIKYYTMYIAYTPYHNAIYGSPVRNIDMCSSITYEEFIRTYGFNPESLKKVC